MRQLLTCLCVNVSILQLYLIAKFNLAEEIGIGKLDHYLVDIFSGAVVTCSCATAQQFHSSAVPVIALNIRSYALR